MSRHSLVAAAAASPTVAADLRERARGGGNGAMGRPAQLSAATAFLDSADGTFIEVHPDPSGFCAVVGHPQLKSNPAQRASASHVFSEYRTRGPALLDGLTGGFALVVHDATDARTLFAGDRLGIHTLSYAPLLEGVIVGRYADEVAAIRSRDVTLSLQALYDYLYFHVIPAPATVFEGVRRLEAAHYGEFRNGRLDIRRYWSPDYHVSKPASFEFKTREFRELLSAAVARDAEGTAVGAFLSGGTDSSSVVGWLAKAAKAPPRAWSIGFDAEGYDEMEYARLAAKHFGAEHHEYYVTPADIVAGVPKLAAHYDQPFGNSSALPAYFCAMKAHEGGVARLLAGDGGDEIFGGNVRYAKQQVFEWYGAVPSPMRRGLLDPLLSNGLARSTPIIKKAASYVAQANIPLPDRLQTYNLLGRLGTRRMLSAGFLDAVDEAHPAREQAAVYARCTDRAAVNRLLAFDLKYTMEDADLPKVVNTCEMAGCEVRFPMLDESLLAFANALPPSDKLRRLRLRPFFKDASRGFLPDAILTKSKHGFGLPFGAWTLRDPALEALARRSLAALVERGLLQPTFVDEVFARELQQYPGFYGEAVWILMMLAQWLDHHAPGFAVAR